MRSYLRLYVLFHKPAVNLIQSLFTCIKYIMITWNKMYMDTYSVNHELLSQSPGIYWRFTSHNLYQHQSSNYMTIINVWLCKPFYWSFEASLQKEMILTSNDLIITFLHIDSSITAPYVHAHNNPASSPSPGFYPSALTWPRHSLPKPPPGSMFKYY